MSRASQAREAIKVAIKAADGVYAVAQRAGIHFTQIYSFLRGGNLRPDNAGKLRAALPDVPAEVWADIAAPVDGDPEPEPVEVTA